jgi:hypothetical protein
MAMFPARKQVCTTLLCGHKRWAGAATYRAAFGLVLALGLQPAKRVK